MKVERVAISLANIEQLLQNNVQEPKFLAQTPQSVKIEKEEGVDTVHISERAKAAYSALRLLKNVLSAPYIRWEKIIEARKALEEGFYVLRKVTEIVAERIRERILGYGIWTENDYNVYNIKYSDILAKRIANFFIPLPEEFNAPLLPQL